MSTPARQETMLRKPILMPPGMIKKVDKIAKNKKVSFAMVVREAVNAFDDEASKDDDVILEALADNMTKTTQEVLGKIKELEKRLDDTHAILEAQ
jgi:predicted transcriptional regulator